MTAPHAPRDDDWPRTSGVLLHLTSLADSPGCGDLGPAAHTFAEFLNSAGQTWWQTLPVTPPGKGFSPYAAQSSFAGGEHLISLELLARDGLLDRQDTHSAGAESGSEVNDQQLCVKRSLVRCAATKFLNASLVRARQPFNEFCETNAEWLDDWALYQAIADAQQEPDWTHWPKDIRLRRPGAIQEAAKALREPIELERAIQYFFDIQWRQLRARCAEMNVRLMGDVPFYPALQSADVWANQSLFDLDANGRPTAVAGVPPDYFSPVGQIWESPLYQWSAHERTDFDWWTARLARANELFDAVRLDHFLGLHRAWRVPVDAVTAQSGQWSLAPGKALLDAIARRAPTLRLVAEDLGVMTPEAARLRDEAHRPSMRVVQFAFDSREDNPNLPANHAKNCVVYTGTHDNNTTQGWIDALTQTDAGQTALGQACAALGAKESDLRGAMIGAVMASPAHTAIVPMQDWMGLGAEARMNTPGTADGNWRWRLSIGANLNEYSTQMRQSAVRTGRAGHD